MHMRRIAAVDSVDHECLLMGTCVCGGDWKLAHNEVSLVGGHWVDYVVVRCDECRLGTAFEFDVSRFFSPRPRVWASAPRNRAARLYRLAAVPAATRMTYGAVA